MNIDTSGKGATNWERVARWNRVHRPPRGDGRLKRYLAMAASVRAHLANPLARIGPPKHSEYHEGGSGGSSSGSEHRTGELLTSLDFGAVARHYRRQWLRRGWELVGDGQAGPVAWSFWEKHRGGDLLQAGWVAHHLPETPQRYSISMTVDVARRGHTTEAD